ncbi:response regulator [Sphingomonas parva]|uniref:histidine kinase n=1 Tax=Sphingomonas parva TaxID=2555898 RepID=A0A4Y8ZP57_9SPHN|nr:PAS domain-containing protein [Sphingomonas parva]TFI57042.1 response regulator [Sphingomonas parva]
MPALIHIVDDDAQVRAATSFLLASRGYATEVYASGTDFLRDARLTRGCILLDLRMPDMDGLAVQQELARRGVRLPVIVTSGHGDIHTAVKAMKLGAHDFLPKPASEEQIFAAIDHALESYRSSEQRRAAEHEAEVRLRRLSPRERQILQGLLAGHPNKVIARLLGLSPRTVEMHRANMMEELGVSTLPEAIRLAIDGGLVPLESDGDGPPAGESVLPRGRPGRPPGPARARSGTMSSDALRLVLEASSDGAWEWSLASGEIKLSLRVAERLGYDPGGSLDGLEALRAIVHPDDWEGLVAELQAHLRGDTESFAAEIRVKTEGGDWVWYQDSGSVIERDAAGQPLRMAGTLSDISARKAEEERARDSAALLDLAQWAGDAGLWELDIDSGRVRLSARGRVLHGLGEDGPEWIERDAWVASVAPGDREAALGGIDSAIRTAAPWRIEYRNAADGTPLLAVGMVVRGADGRPARMVGFAQARDGAGGFRLSAPAAETESAGESAAVPPKLAHELRQPLAAIANFARAIRSRLGPSAAEDEMLREALSGAERSALLASDIVERLSRDEAEGRKR